MEREPKIRVRYPFLLPSRAGTCDLVPYCEVKTVGDKKLVSCFCPFCSEEVKPGQNVWNEHLKARHKVSPGVKTGRLGGGGGHQADAALLGELCRKFVVNCNASYRKCLVCDMLVEQSGGEQHVKTHFDVAGSSRDLCRFECPFCREHLPKLPRREQLNAHLFYFHVEKNFWKAVIR